MKRPLRFLAPLALVAAGVVAAGCYRRVVRQEGLGSKPRDVYEPNREGPDLVDRLDDAVWGAAEPKQR